MKSNLKNVCCIIAAVILIAGLVAGAVSEVYAQKANPGVIPPNARPFGMTYAEWSAEWWKWQFKLPATSHPAFDLTGENCGAGQEGKVWFLTGAFTSEFPGNPSFNTIVRESCSVPSGKAIFFPIINNECSTEESPPWALDSASCAAKFFDSRVAVARDLSATLDGMSLENLEAFRVKSPVFQFSLPEDNILGVDCSSNEINCVDPLSVSDGYWLMLSPLSVGEHTIRFTGSFIDPNNNDPTTNLIFGLDVTYVLTVVGGKK